MRGDSVDVKTSLWVMGRDDHTWRGQAACRGIATSLFFPDAQLSGYGEQVARAKAVCAGCIVIEQCRAWALFHPRERGVWGGMTEAERRAVRRGAAA